MKAQPTQTAKHAGSVKHHASNKHKPHAPSAAQLAARKKFAAAGAHARHVTAVARHAGQAQPAKWSPGVDVACCAVEALAASLRMSGREVSDLDVLGLYGRITDDPDRGATIVETIEAAAVHGLAGALLVDARPVRHASPGVVLGVDLAERHAVTVDGHGVWTWGAWRPVSCGLLAAADEAWELTWQ